MGDQDRMLDDQGGRCDICRDELTRPYVDHCHKTGYVRSLLCHGCNTGLGNFKDDPKLLEAAKAYLEVKYGLAKSQFVENYG